MNAAISWSGGKDCCLALLRTRSSFNFTAAITVFTETGERSRSHGHIMGDAHPAWNEKVCAALAREFVATGSLDVAAIGELESLGLDVELERVGC